MLSKQRLATRAICERIPFELQVFMWHCIDALTVERDYLQVEQVEECINKICGRIVVNK